MIQCIETEYNSSSLKMFQTHTQLVPDHAELRLMRFDQVPNAMYGFTDSAVAAPKTSHWGNKSFVPSRNNLSSPLHLFRFMMHVIPGTGQMYGITFDIQT